MKDAVNYGIAMYIVRNEAAKDLFGVLEKLKAIGYDGVELLGFFGKKPAEIRKKAAELNLKVIGNHVGLSDFLADTDRVLAGHKEAGCEYLTIAQDKGAFTPGTPGFNAMIADMKTLIGKCRNAGLTPLYHNHNWDMAGDNPYAGQVLDALAEDGLCFEPDIGWMVYALADPAVFLKKYNSRCEVLHFKDIYATDVSKLGADMPGDVKRSPDRGFFEFRPTGYGIVDYPRLMPYCLACGPKWIVTDHDLAYERDPYEDLRVSLEYSRMLATISSS